MAGLWEQLDQALSWGKGNTTSNQIWDRPHFPFSKSDNQDVERETELEKENAKLLKELAEATIKLAEKRNDDRKTGLWTVEGFTEEEVVDVRPKTSVTDIEVRHCAGLAETMNIRVHGMCNSLKVEKCTNVRILCDDVIERVDVSNCQKIELVLGGRNRTMVLSNCHLVLVTASHLMFQDPGVETLQCTQLQMRWTTSRPGRTMTAEELLLSPLDGMLMAPEATSTVYKDYEWTSSCKIPIESMKTGNWEVRDKLPVTKATKSKTQIFSQERWVQDAVERRMNTRGSAAISPPPQPDSQPQPPTIPPTSIPSVAPPPAPAAQRQHSAPPPPPQPAGGQGQQGGGVVEGSMAWAWFDYDASNADELSFKATEQLRLVQASPDPGWFVADASDGRRGLVPITHLRLPDAGQTLAFQQTRRAAFDYSAAHPDELSFQAGDVVGIISVSVDEGWYHASVNDKVGLIPATHLHPAD